MPVTADTASRADLLRALGALAEPPGPAQRRLSDLLDLPAPSARDWTEAFAVQLVPHASVYLGAEGMIGGDAADRVAGFWRALHQSPPADADHLTALLGLYAGLTEAVAAEPPGPHRVLLARARTALLHEHLLSWLPAYLRAMADVGPAAYAAWAGLLRETLRREAADAGGPPERLAAHLHAVPPLGDPADLDGLLRAVLAPARSGIILTRGHLAALARDGRLGLRLGDRLPVLRALVEQDPPGVLGRLAGHARSWATRHRADRPLTGPAAHYWAARAHATAAVLTAGTAPPAGPR